MINKGLDIQQISNDLLESQLNIEKMEAILSCLIEEYEDEAEKDIRVKRLLLQLKIIYDYVSASGEKLEQLQNLI